MTKEEQYALTQKAKQRLDELNQLIAQNHAFSSKKGEQDDDPDAGMDLLINASVDAKLAAEHKAEMRTLEQTLAWLKSDDAGYCESCGEEIPVARLSAALGTRQCVNCADSTQKVFS